MEKIEQFLSKELLVYVDKHELIICLNKYSKTLCTIYFRYDYLFLGGVLVISHG